MFSATAQNTVRFGHKYSVDDAVSPSDCSVHRRAWQRRVTDWHPWRPITGRELKTLKLFEPIMSRGKRALNMWRENKYMTDICVWWLNIHTCHSHLWSNLQILHLLNMVLKRQDLVIVQVKLEKKLHSSCLHYHVHVVINAWFNLKRWNTTAFSRKKNNILLWSSYLYFRGNF